VRKLIFIIRGPNYGVFGCCTSIPSRPSQSFAPEMRSVIKKLDNRGGRQNSLNTHFQFDLNGKRFAYCRIRKNGCSAMQRLIIETSPYKQHGSASEYEFLRKHHRVPKMNALRSANHRILVIRDPVERIFSLFTNKFVQRIGNVGIFNSYRLVTGKDPNTASFRDFVVDYVSRLGDVVLDPHVWPQHWHLCPVVYDCVVQLGELSEGMAEIFGNELARQFFHDKINPSQEFDVWADPEMFTRISTIYAEDIRMMESIELAQTHTSK